MSDVRLTKAERERFENHLRWHFDVVAEQGKNSSYISLGILNAVSDLEAIVAARLAAQREAVEAALAKVDRSWGGAAMVVKDTVLSIFGHRCTDEFCEHDHKAMRDLRAAPTTAEPDDSEAVQAASEGMAE